MRGMDVPASLLLVFPPSANLLFERARRHTSDEMLWEIAKADYGIRADEVMPELRAIRDSGVVPYPMSRTLGEVLNLTHYCNPDVPELPPFEPGPSGLRGHQTRLFACSVFLQIKVDRPEEDAYLPLDSALAQALVSAGVVGEPMSEAAACYLTWRLTREGIEPLLLAMRCHENPEPLLAAFGLLVLAVRLRSGRFAEPELGEVARWVLEREWLERREFPLDPRPQPFSVHSGFWQPLVEELRTEAEAIREAETRVNLQLCGMLLDSSG